MDGSSDPASLSDSAVLDVTGKIMIAGVIVLFIVIAFIFILHLYSSWFWPRSEDPTVVSWRRQLAGQNRPSSRPRGLDGSALQSLPVVAYNPKDFKDALECAVCLSELQQGEKARFLPKCNHGFHAECIDMWFGSHSTCPICRTNVVSSDPGPDPDPNPGLDSIRVDSSLEVAVYPTNVLFWGDDTEVRSADVAASSRSSTDENGRIKERLCVDIAMEGESGSSSTGRVGAEEEAMSPVMNRIRSLKRLLSRGKRVSPYPRDSSSGSADVEQV